MLAHDVSLPRFLATLGALIVASLLPTGCSSTCTEAELTTALEAAGDSGVVVVGDCLIETSGIVVPPGVTLSGTSGGSEIRGVGAGPAVTLSAGSTLTEVVVSSDTGIAVAAFGVGAARLTDVTIVGPVSAETVAAYPASATATRIGLLLRDSGDRAAPIELERVRVRGFADVSVALLSSNVRWQGGEIADGLGAGLLASGGHTELGSVTLRDMLQEGRLSTTYAGVFLRGAEVESDGLAVLDNEGGGLMHDDASAVHRQIEVRNNALFGVWTQRSPSFELSGEGSVLASNGRVGLAIHEPAGPHLVADATIAETQEVPRAVGRWGMDGVADGVHLVAEDTTDLSLSALSLSANLRAGALLHVRGGVVDPASFRDVAVDASGDAFGVVAQDASGVIPSDTWDAEVTRTGAAAVNDPVASPLDILSAVEPMGLPAPPS